MGSDFWRESFGPMLAGTHRVAFGDLVGIEKQLATKTIAAVVLEPIQAEGGIVLPPADYLVGVQKLCRTYGTLFVLDEVQTGMGRTGTFLAGQRYGVELTLAANQSYRPYETGLFFVTHPRHFVPGYHRPSLRDRKVIT
jgi:acetylornithine/succinyldiaminopimelate/putrescine aminotransferase